MVYKTAEFLICEGVPTLNRRYHVDRTLLLTDSPHYYQIGQIRYYVTPRGRVVPIRPGEVYRLS